MRTLKRKLPERISGPLFSHSEASWFEEIRFRVGQPAEARFVGQSRFIGEALSARDLNEILLALSDHSLYAFEEELRQGYFTLEDGCRVGVTGRFALGDNRVLALSNAQAICVRVAREIKGCADPLMPALLKGGRPRSVLIVSPPGMGKTTMLRDAARQLSGKGLRVAIADERGELAGAHLGQPTLDVGPRSDVADRLNKRVAIPQLLRTMSPDVIVTDELGAPCDAEAVEDALRCGVAVVASAHGESLQTVMERPALSELIVRRAFSSVAVLGGRPGNILGIYALKDARREDVALYESVGS